MDQKMVDAINKQINAELWSAYIYYAMAAWLEANDLPGMATWMKVQVQEELFHADKFFNFLVERGGRVNALAHRRSGPGLGVGVRGL